MSAREDVDAEQENAELLLFQARESYVYIIPPRKSAASYRADEWNVNKWAWEGTIKIVSKGDQCAIRLEDSNTGELYAQAPVRQNEPSPVEAVIDSSRYFVLRIEDTHASGRSKHAFIGIGFRERPQAYDFQAALHDHVKYMNKKKEAEEMEKEYQSKPSVDYSLKEGETLRLQFKSFNSSNSSNSLLSPRNRLPHADSFDASALQKALPPPPSPGATVKGLSSTNGGSAPPADSQTGTKVESTEQKEGADDDDFGDFQAA